MDAVNLVADSATGVERTWTPRHDIILVHHFNVCLVFSRTSFISVYSLLLQRTQGFDSHKSQSSRNRQCPLCSLATLCWFEEKQWHWHMSVELLVGFCLCTVCPDILSVIFSCLRLCIITHMLPLQTHVDYVDYLHVLSSHSTLFDILVQ